MGMVLASPLPQLLDRRLHLGLVLASSLLEGRDNAELYRRQQLAEELESL